MNHTPEISIIIPIYNTASTLETCIQSVLEQDFQDWEAILVDDGSSDNSYNQASDLSQKDSRIKVLQQEHQGVSAARNLALSHAQGKYICFIDADDTIEPNYLSSLYTYREYDIVICGYYVDFYKNNNLIKKVTHLPSKINTTNIKNRDILEPLFLNGMLNTNWNKLYKNEIIKQYKIRFKYYPINEDNIFTLEYIKHISSFYTIRKSLYHWIRIENKKTGVNSLPSNIIDIYNEAHLLTREFFQENSIADKILYYSYYFITLKYLSNLSKKESATKLKEFHQNSLVKASYNAYHPQSFGEKLLHELQKKGMFQFYYKLYQFINKWKR